MLMTATFSFAWVWNARPWGEAHICQSLCAEGNTCSILEVLLYFWFSMQRTELRLFTFDFHFKDLFIVGMVIKWITLSDFDLYSYVLITTMIRWLRDDKWYLTELITLIEILPETLVASMIYGPVPEQHAKSKFQCCKELSNLCTAILPFHISVYLQQHLAYCFLAQDMQWCFANLIFVSLQSPRTLSPTPSAEVSLVEPLGTLSYCD